MTFRAVVVVGLAYLLGSLDFAVLVARARGVDIYQVGSGNPGTANVLRTLGRGAATAVMIGDVAKGVVAAILGELLGGAEVVGYASGCAAVLGHCFPVWHRFRGGKGVATAGGMVLWLAPLVAVGAAVVWLVLVRLTGISSVGSLAVTVLAVPALALLDPPAWGVVWLSAVAMLVVVRHRDNLRRLLRGEERRVRPVHPTRPDEAR
ncbi:MAG: glycerol-3-phosphate 1-O-acyltransferase PlsY [Acidimicrobiia bacterium]